MNDRFEVTRLVFNLRLLDDLRAQPFKGSALRGVLGHVLKRALCLHQRLDCASCPEATCTYKWFYESTDEKGRQIPPPYVIEPPEIGESVLPAGTNISFGLVLVGRAIKLSPLLIMIFDEGGRIGMGTSRAKYVVESVIEEGNGIVFQNGTLAALPKGFTLAALQEEKPPSSAVIEIITPMHIRANGAPACIEDFSSLFNALWRRLKLLARYHCGFRIEGDAVLREMARAVSSEWIETGNTVIKRYSGRQEKSISYYSMVGKMAVSGLEPELWSCLKLGEYVHVGKGCTFGLGRYSLMNKQNVVDPQ
ncbi:MAG: CRISPR system precrRNA processing endoribonuclease RAMP protein Cas6 [Syntrophomonadales bacterium]|jgi:hypothetical protein